MIIECKNLQKTYRRPIKRAGLKGMWHNLFHSEYELVPAIQGLDLQVPRGQAIACIGENGAGKSTLIKMLVGILQPTSGQVRVLGVDPQGHQRDFLRRISVVFGQKTNLWWDIPICESFAASQKIYGTDPQVHRQRLDEVVELLDLGHLLHVPARQLSLGQRMKADLAMAFLHSPEIIFLDEPTLGLDVNIKYELRRFIRRKNETEGVTIFLTSHDLADIEVICDEALILNKGKTYYRGSLHELMELYGRERHIHIQGRPRSEETLQQELTRRFPNLEINCKPLETEIHFTLDDYKTEAILQLLPRYFEISDLTIQAVTVEEVVASIFATNHSHSDATIPREDDGGSVALSDGQEV